MTWARPKWGRRFVTLYGSLFWWVAIGAGAVAIGMWDIGSGRIFSGVTKLVFGLSLSFTSSLRIGVWVDHDKLRIVSLGGWRMRTIRKSNVKAVEIYHPRGLNYRCLRIIGHDGDMERAAMVSQHVFMSPGSLELIAVALREELVAESPEISID